MSNIAYEQKEAEIVGNVPTDAFAECAHIIIDAKSNFHDKEALCSWMLQAG